MLDVIYAVCHDCEQKMLRLGGRQFTEGFCQMVGLATAYLHHQILQSRPFYRVGIEIRSVYSSMSQSL